MYKSVNVIAVNLSLHWASVFWDVAPCRSCVNRRFEETSGLHLQGRKIHERGTSMSRWLADWANSRKNQLYKNRGREGGRESGLHGKSALKMEAIRSSETSIHTRCTWCNIAEDGILHSHRCENLKSYIRWYYVYTVTKLCYIEECFKKSCRP
jgi:hypothetical protein